MGVVGFGVVLAFILPRPVAAITGEWATFTFANDIRALVEVGNALWCATGGGAVRFARDSQTFTKYTNVDGLGGTDLSSLVVDPAGCLWFGSHGGGMSRFDPTSGRWRRFDLLDGLASLEVTTLHRDGDNLWIGTDRGVSLFRWQIDPEEGDFSYLFQDAFLAEKGLPLRNVTALASSSQRLWIGTGNGLACADKAAVNLKDPANWTLFGRQDGLPDNRVIGLAVVDSVVWVGTKRGVSRRHNGMWETANKGLEQQEIQGLAYRGERLWVGTLEGVFWFDGSGWVRWGSVIPDRGARTVWVDGAGTVWVGTVKRGLGQWSDTEWRYFQSEGPAGNLVTDIAIDPNGGVWFAFGEGGGSYFDGNRWVNFSAEDGLIPGGIVALGIDSQGHKWFGTWGKGVARLEDGGTLNKADDRWTWLDQHNSPLRGIPNDPNFVVVNAFAVDPPGFSGALWLSNFEVGLVRHTGSGQWRVYGPATGLVGKRIRSLAVDLEGTIWVAVEQQGLSRFMPSTEQWHQYTLVAGLPSNQVWSVAVGPDSLIWAATEAGLAQFDGTLWQSVALPGGLGTNVVRVVDLDARGNPWIGTTEGAAFFSQLGFAWQVFNSASSPLVDSNVQALAVNRASGEVWLGTANGLSRFESGILPPRTSLSEVLVYPQPFIPAQGDQVLVFDRLAEGSTLRIFTLAGELVREIPSEDLIAQQFRWDGTNRAGKPVAGGVYLFLVSTFDGQTRSGKFVLIR